MHWYYASKIENVDVVFDSNLRIKIKRIEVEVLTGNVVMIDLQIFRLFIMNVIEKPLVHLIYGLLTTCKLVNGSIL